MRNIRFVSFAVFAALLIVVSAMSAASAQGSDRSGFDASVASKRATGSYNNYCETWAVDVPKVQTLFGACK